MVKDTIHVLLLEDDQFDVELMRAVLTASHIASFSLESCSTLQKLKEIVSQPGIILTDLGLPDSFGIGTFRAVKGKFPDTPIIVLSGNNEMAMARAAVKEGAQDFIVKDSNYLKSIERSILYALERHEDLNTIKDLSKKTRDFSARIGEDLDRIILSIFANIEILRSMSSEDLQEPITSIEESAIKARKLAQNMLIYAGLTTFSKKDLLVNQEILDNEYLFHLECKGAALELRLCPDHAIVFGDELLIRNAIRELLANAAEAIGSRTGVIRIETWVDSGDVCIAVEDDGPGIDPAKLKHVFEPFYTTKCNRHGLGLAALQGTLLSHGGDIAITSVPGKTRVTITLPASPQN